MRKLSLTLSLCMITLWVLAIPAKRGVWTTVRLADGTELRVEARGDEHVRYWQAVDGTCYVRVPGTDVYTQVDDKSLQQTTYAKRARMVAAAQRKASQRHYAYKQKSIFQGQKKGLIILVQFKDRQFSMSNPQELYRRIANEEGYSEGDFQGSIKDYFRAQSGGQFEIDFDVAGPVTLDKPYSYYGNNGEALSGEMIRDACIAVDATIDFTKYDWDGDREVEEVYVLYAGYGQADYNPNDDRLIWPHMFSLSSCSPAINLRLDGVKIDIYACSNELNFKSQVSGIGTFCHEFSHCMGFPDIYDVGEKSDNFGKDEWDLMDYGNYNGDGYCPVGYSAYEKMVCGWTEPVELTTDTTITDMKSISDMGQTYVIYNQANRNEFYTLENRQHKGFDRYLAGHGLLVGYVDYDEAAWAANAVTVTGELYNGYTNSHPRLTIIPADNSRSRYSVEGDAYPYNDNDSLTNLSVPAATLYNANSDGRKYMNCSILRITEHADSTISFEFKAVADTGSGNNSVPAEGRLLYESFDKCNGTGGNDGQWGGKVAASAFSPDLSGWLFGKGYGGDRCARFNTGGSHAIVLSPAFTLPGDTVTLTFNAASWANAVANLYVELSGNAQFVTINGTDSRVLIQPEKGAWSTHSMKIVGTGVTRLAFDSSSRFFLDEVLVLAKVTTGIGTTIAGVNNATGSHRIYSISGQYMGTDLRTLPRGIYIVNGKKVVK